LHGALLKNEQDVMLFERLAFMARRPSELMPTPGGCLCGAVRYTIAAEPLGARMCWCRDCQRIASGSATVNVLFLEEAVAITGDLALFTMIADSGNTVERGFCKVCGAQIYRAHRRA